MGHCSMKTIVDMAKGAATGVILKDLPSDISKLDSCPSCTLMKVKCLPSKAGHMCALQLLELIHSDLVGLMPIESVSCCRYGFILVDNYLRAGWVLPLHAKLDAPKKFELWISLLENRTSKKVKTVMFDNAGELVAGQMREICDEHSIHIIWSIPHSPSSNSVAE